MRFRSYVTLAVGAGLGAGAMYLLDPDAGERRRRELRRDAYRQVKEGAVTATKAGMELSRDLGAAAIEGYQEARAEPDA